MPPDSGRAAVRGPSLETSRDGQQINQSVPPRPQSTKKWRAASTLVGAVLASPHTRLYGMRQDTESLNAQLERAFNGQRLPAWGVHTRTVVVLHSGSPRTRGHQPYLRPVVVNARRDGATGSERCTLPIAPIACLRVRTSGR